MKETKVYVDELPESCGECSCHSIMEDRCVLLRKQAIEPFLQSCPLQSLQIHDRELVKEVCEKIRKTIASTVDLAESNQQIKDQFNIILDLIQKEFER